MVRVVAPPSPRSGPPCPERCALRILARVLSAEAFVARTQRRGHRRGHVVMVLVVGLMAAMSIALIAGSRRSSSVVQRFFAAAPHYDVQIGFTADNVAPGDVRSIPGVERAALSEYMAFVADAGGQPQGINAIATDLSVKDPTVRVLQGRLPASEDEVAVNQAFVHEFKLSVGDRLPVQ